MSSGHLRTTPIAPELAPDYARGVAFAVNFALGHTPPVPTGATGHSLSRVDIEPVNTYHRPKKVVSLARIISDRCYLSDLGLRESDVEELRTLAADDASTAALFLEELMSRLGTPAFVDARGFYGSAACARIKMRALAGPALSCKPMVKGRDVMLEIPLTDDDEGIYLETRFWKFDDLDAVRHHCVHREKHEVMLVASDAKAMDVSLMSGGVLKNYLDFLDPDDTVPKRAPTDRERAVADHAASGYYRPTRQIGEYLYLDFNEDSGVLRASESVSTKHDDTYHYASEKAEGVMAGVLTTVDDKRGVPVGHRCVIGGRHVTPVHVVTPGRSGLFMCRADEYGLVTAPAVKSTDYTLFFMLRGELRSVPVRSVHISAHRATMNFTSSYRLRPGMSGGVIVDDAFRAVAVVERAVSFALGLYEAYLVSDDTVDFFSELSSPEDIHLTAVRGHRAPVYEYVDEVEGFEFRGYSQGGSVAEYALTPNGFLRIVADCVPLATNDGKRPMELDPSDSLEFDADVRKFLLAEVMETSVEVALAKVTTIFGEASNDAVRAVIAEAVEALAKSEEKKRRSIADRKLIQSVDPGGPVEPDVITASELGLIKYEPKDPEVFRVNVSRARMHESIPGTHGRMRALAVVGDAAARLALVACLYDKFHMASSMQSTLSMTQSNAAFSDIMQCMGWDQLLRTAMGVRATTSIRATLFEAVVGAVYLDDGIRGVHRFHESISFLAIPPD